MGHLRAAEKLGRDYQRRRHTPQRLKQPLGPHTVRHQALVTSDSPVTARMSADAAIASARFGAKAETPMTMAIAAAREKILLCT